ncbi:MAG: sigma 54-interacting transcriptional regulator, partial [Vicinamibacterales bacterium]
MARLDKLVGEHPSIAAVRNGVCRVLERTTAGGTLPPILILGETGTGKGLLASSIHHAGSRAAGPLVAINCAAIPETLLEAELFGYERGAFTGAQQAKPGLFQAAHRGTLFLDEIAELPEALQPKLLKAIEEREVRRLGSIRSEPIDVSIIAATSVALPAAGRRFSDALYHRLSVLTFRLPPLRERGRDIVRLAEAFLAKTCADYRLPPKGLVPDAQAALMTYAWPGNVRELGNVIERAALLTDGPAIGSTQLGLPPELARGGAGVAAADAVDRARLLDALDRTDWNVTHAAEHLGLSRNIVRYRIEKYDLRAGAGPR